MPELLWLRVGGILLAVTGAVWLVRRKIPVGIEGEPPALSIKGGLVVFLGTLLPLFGIACAVWPQLLRLPR